VLVPDDPVEHRNQDQWPENGQCGGEDTEIFLFFSDYSFWVHHPVNQDDRHLLAHAMASDFSVAWQFLLKRTIFFCFGSNSIPLSH
jgi:hypothetical protein